MNQSRSIMALIFIAILGVGAALAFAMHQVGANGAAGIGVGALILALIVSSAIRVADQWDRAVILRLGKFQEPKWTMATNDKWAEDSASGLYCPSTKNSSNGRLRAADQPIALPIGQGSNMDRDS